MATFDLSALHAHLVATGPLIQNITNTVVQQFSANVLLAIGAAPAMIDHEADAGQFASIADGVLVNFGTATSHQFLAADAAVQAAHEADKPWVLDPVSVGVTDYRTGRIRQAANRKPTVVRGNASEIAALAGMGTGGRGVDTTDEVDAVLPAATRLAMMTGGVVAVSGERDAVVEIVDDTVQVARIEGGHALMARVIGTGCSLGSAAAAYLAARHESDDSRQTADFEATVAAHAHFALAGRVASEHAQGPGSYAAAFLDALYAFESGDMERAQISIDSYQLDSLVSEDAVQS